MRPCNCDDIQDKLVDYADDVLPPEESHAIVEHLDTCAACRETVADLQRSLSLTQAIWSDNLAAAHRGGAEPATTRIHWFRYAAAAGILIAAGAVLFVNSHHSEKELTLTFEQIQQQIERTATAARLLAATNLIAQCEGVESIVAKQYSHILTHYGDTPAAATIRANEQTLLKGIHND